jgi:hypothetical protein
MWLWVRIGEPMKPFLFGEISSLGAKEHIFWRSMILLSKNATQKNMVSVHCVLHFDPHPFAATFPEERRSHRILWHGSSSTIDNRRHGDDRWDTPIVFSHGHGDYPLVMTKSLRT